MSIGKYLTDVCERIESAKDRVYSALRVVATASACRAEIMATLQMLATAEERQSVFLQSRCDRPVLAVFLPGNMVLYSLALYAIVPARLLGSVVVRASGRTVPVVKGIMDILGTALPSNVRLWETDRDTFRDFALRSSACVFCGAFGTGERLSQEAALQTLFLYLGGGVNPFVVTRSANIKEAVSTAISERTFNGGRDCICPDLFLVEQSVAGQFLPALEQEIRALRSGPLEDDNAVICPIDNAAGVNRIRKFCTRFRQSVVCGGDINVRTGMVAPTLVVRTSNSDVAAPEFFGPVWNVVVYNDQSELTRWLWSMQVLRRAQGITVFGNEQIRLPYTCSVVAFNTGLQTVEDGNRPFGGWGSQASFVSSCGEYHRRPILVANELSDPQGRVKRCNGCLSDGGIRRCRGMGFYEWSKAAVGTSYVLDY